MVAEIVAICVALFAMLAEWLHARRVSLLAGLAFGPVRRPRTWAQSAFLLRIVSLTALAWGLMTLLLLSPKVHRLLGNETAKERHLLLLLDVSPSMRLTDAGPLGKISRRERAQEILESFLQRVSTDHYRISVLAFFNGVKPVVVDTKDAEVVRHILADLPLYQAFKPGKTKLYEGLKEAAEVARRWGPKSTSIMVLTDGDTESAKAIPTMPASVANILFVGIGDSRAGSYIAGRQSKQDSSALRQIAARLHGLYVDGNAKHIPSKVLAEMQAQMSEDTFQQFGRREYAMVACGLGGFVLALLPLMLHSFGTAWQPGVRQPGTSAGQMGIPARRSSWNWRNLWQLQ